jgi:hypothetical protein
VDEETGLKLVLPLSPVISIAGEVEGFAEEDAT